MQWASNANHNFVKLDYNEKYKKVYPFGPIEN